MIGRTISNYRILEKIGEGGMGVVYKARDMRLDRVVALKFLRGEAFADPEQKARFMREAQTAAALDHPNICTVYGIQEVGERIFIAMAFVEGADLKRLLKSGPVDIDKAVMIAVQAANGLDAAHKKGVIHRDIKSANIILTQDGNVKVMDFGLAKMRGGAEISKTTIGVGTPLYMSPEQARGDRVDHRTDIWSLGVCLYEMLTGQLPFRGDYDPAVIYSILNEDPEPVADVRPEIPAGLQQVLDRMLAKSPDHRYASAAELVSDLEAPEAVRLASGGDGLSRIGVQPSIAVLPFADMSADRDQEYFCDGIAEEITSKLARVVGIRVASRTSAFVFKGKHEDIREIGRKLGVSALLEGSVRKAGKRVRVTGQLIGVSDGYHLWSGQFDRELEDVFAIQDEIARRIVEALSITLSEREKRRFSKRTTADIGAYDFYLRGRQFFHRVSHRDMGFAREMFARAIDRDPGYALAHAGLADCHSYMREYFARDESHLAEALEHSRKAVELDPELAEAHASRGLAASITKRYEEAQMEFETAIRLNPQLFEVYLFYARMCFSRGEFEKAAALFEKAELASPADYQTPVLLAQTYRAMNQPENNQKTLRRALEVVERHLDFKPDDTRAMYMKAAAHLELGEREKALDWARRAASIGTDDPPVLYFMSCLHSRMGDTGKALDYLERAVLAGFSHWEWLLTDPDMASLRDHPRFKTVVDGLS